MTIKYVETQGDEQSIAYVERIQELAHELIDHAGIDYAHTRIARIHSAMLEPERPIWPAEEI